MSNTLKNNAYHILGLDTTASQKDIFNRSKEIINRLKIDDLPEYNLDVGLFNDFRTEEAAKEAIQKLQTPKKRIKEYFFWFQIAGNIDEQALGLLKSKDFENALRVWENVAKKGGVKSYFYKKNLAILYCLLLFIDENKNYLRDSLSIWKELIESDKFWIAFSKTYNLHDEQTASQELITDFKNHVVNYLADIYTELYQTHKNADYISQFQKIFSAKGERMEKIVLWPAYQVINEAVEKLEKMKFSADGIFDKQEKKNVKELIGLIRVELNNLIDFGLYNDSQTRIMRDMAASALRGLYIDLHNNLKEEEIALGLAIIAEEISGMETTKSKIQTDIATLQGNLEYKAKEERIIKHGKPIGNAPSMRTINGIGTRVYGDTQYVVVLFIPVIPIARYSLENHGDGSYIFFSELELHKWQKYWQYILIGIVAIWILRAIFSG